MSTNDQNPQSSPGNPPELDRLGEVLKELQANAPFLVDSGKTGAAAENRTSTKACPDVGKLAATRLRRLYAREEQRRLLAHVPGRFAPRASNFSRRVSAFLRGMSHQEELGSLRSVSINLAAMAASPCRRTGPHSPPVLRFCAFRAISAGASPASRPHSFLFFPSSCGVVKTPPTKLLAEAYSQSRFFDLRVPGAGFAPVSPQMHLRGGGGDHESAPLLSARAAIEHKLERSPNDTQWLQLQARAQILDEQYDQAIDTLDRLVAAGPVTPSLLLDDGSAYFLRGTASGEVKTIAQPRSTTCAAPTTIRPQ